MSAIAIEQTSQYLYDVELWSEIVGLAGQLLRILHEVFHEQKESGVSGFNSTNLQLVKISRFPKYSTDNFFSAHHGASVWLPFWTYDANSDPVRHFIFEVRPLRPVLYTIRKCSPSSLIDSIVMFATSAALLSGFRCEALLAF